MSDDVRGVLGRYGPQGSADEELVEVRLLNFPLQVFAKAREHHDELLREFALLAIHPPRDKPGAAVPTRLLELVELLGRRYGGAGEVMDTVREGALERGELTIDLTYHLPPTAVPAIETLHLLMAEADEFCKSEQLLTLASTRWEREFRIWFLEQFMSQLDGAEPVPWSGPLVDTE